jgi:aquaporin Z
MHFCMYHKYLGEFLGSALLTFVAIKTSNALFIAIAYFFALILLGKISKGYFNPAITLALMYNNKLPRSDVLPYIVMQIGGALCVYSVLQMI